MCNKGRAHRCVSARACACVRARRACVFGCMCVGGVCREGCKRGWGGVGWGVGEEKERKMSEAAKEVRGGER